MSAVAPPPPNGGQELLDPSQQSGPTYVAPLAAPTTPAALIDPDGQLGTRFFGPVMSGPLGQLAGIASLHKRAKITFANGTFSVPIQFPPSTILDRLIVQIQQSYNGTTPHINLGTTANGVDIATVDVSVAPTQIFQNLTTIMGSSWTIYLSQALTAATTGKATVLIYYSVPAKTVPS